LIGLLFSLEFIHNPENWLRGLAGEQQSILDPVWSDFLCRTVIHLHGNVAALFMLVHKNRSVLLLSLAAVIPLVALMALSLVNIPLTDMRLYP